MLLHLYFGWKKGNNNNFIYYDPVQQRNYRKLPKLRLGNSLHTLNTHIPDLQKSRGMKP